MSDKGKMRRAKREEKQEREGREIVKWIFFGLIGLALLFTLYLSLSM